MPKNSTVTKLCHLAFLALRGPLKARIHYTSWQFPRKSVTSWQLPRLRGSYGETCVMDFGHSYALLCRTCHFSSLVILSYYPVCPVCSYYGLLIQIND